MIQIFAKFVAENGAPGVASAADRWDAAEQVNDDPQLGDALALLERMEAPDANA